MKTIPQIVLWFTQEEQFLKQLVLENAGIQDVLAPAEMEKICQLKPFYGLPLARLVEVLSREDTQKHLAIFHYGGHMVHQGVSALDEKGETLAADLGKLLPLLKRCKHLRLVFLNGCYSLNQANTLQEGGVPVVIGTENAVRDSVALKFAVAFYKRLNDKSINVAFEAAKSHLETEYSNKRDTYFRDTHRGIGLSDSYSPFIINYKDGFSDHGNWSLAEAAGNPLFGLPPLSDQYTYHFPAHPFRYLCTYREENAKIFFGRGTKISSILRSINDFTPKSLSVLTLSGPSGVGKSSLLRAGILPRLSSIARVIYLKWDPQTGFPQQIRNALSVSGEDLNTAWKQVEKIAGLPLVIILDQIDELFNRTANPSREQEWMDLLQVIKQVFGVPKMRPKGKIALSYRSEIDQLINQGLKEQGFDRIEHYIPKLDRQSIVEIVHSLDQSNILDPQVSFRLEVEDGLGDNIATFLLQDPKSPIAPVLQVLLTRMWQENGRQEVVHFTKSGFTRWTEKGIWLDEFFSQQINQLKAEEDSYTIPVERNGLVLDLLDFHLTARATGQSHSLKDLLNAYHHIEPGLIRQLLFRLKDLGLLVTNAFASARISTVPGEQLQLDQQTSLAHDTLGPVVREAVERSTRPGQHGRRILKSKMTEYQNDPEHTFLEGQDLQKVLSGKQGMRAWTGPEKRLIETSRQRLKEIEGQSRKRKRLIVWLSLLTVGVTVLATYLYRQNTNVSGYLSLKNTAVTDPSEALRKMHVYFTDHQLPQRYLADQYEIYRPNLIYSSIHEDEVGFNKAAFSTDGRWLATSNQNNQTVYLYQSPYESPIDSFTMARSQISDITFDPGGCLYIASLDRRGYQWCPFASTTPITFFPAEASDSTYLKQIIPTGRGSYCYTLHADGTVNMWDKTSGQWTHTLQPEQENAVIAERQDSSGNNGIWIGTQTGMIKGFGASGEELAGFQVSSPQHITAIAQSGRTLLIGLAEGTVEVWENLNEQWKFARSCPGTQGAVKQLKFLMSDRWFLTVYEEGWPAVWDQQTETKIFELSGQSYPLIEAIFLIDEQSILTADEGGNIRRWPLPSPHPIQINAVSDYAIMSIGFKDKNTVYTVDKSGQVISVSLSGFTARTLSPGFAILSIPPAFAPQAEHLLIASKPDRMGVFLPQSGKQLDREYTLPGLLNMTAGSSFIAATSDSMLRVWKMNGEMLWEKRVDHPVHLSITEPEQYLLVLNSSGDAYWYDLVTGKLRENVSLHREIVDAVPGRGGQVLLSDQNGNLILLTPDQVPEIRKGGYRTALAANRDIYVLQQDARQLDTWSLDGHQLSTFLLSSAGNIRCLAISPDGQWLAAGTDNGSIAFWKIIKQPLPLSDR